MLISTINGPAKARAEIHSNNQGYFIEYYDMNGLKLPMAYSPSSEINIVAEHADSWVNGLQQLDG